MRHDRGRELWELCPKVPPSQCFSYQEEENPLGISMRTSLFLVQGIKHSQAQPTAECRDSRDSALGSHSLALCLDPAVHQLCELGQNI